MIRLLRRTLKPFAVLGLAVGFFPAGADPADPARAAQKDLKGALQAGDVEAADSACHALAITGGAGSMRLILDCLERMPASQDSLYWSLIGGAVSFGDRKGLEELGKFLARNKQNAVARDVLYGLAKNVSYNVVGPLRPLLKEAPDDIRALVAAKICRVRTHEAVDALVEVLKHETADKPEKLSRIALTAIDGLTRLTGQKLGASTPNWEGWWQKNRANPLPTVAEVEERSRTGTAVDLIKLSPDKERKEAFIGVEQAPLKAVVVLTAIWTKKYKGDKNNDHMEVVLDRMNVPFTAVKREDFAKYDLSEAGVLLVNCAQFHEFCYCPKCKPSGKQNNRLFTCSGCSQHMFFQGILTGADVQKITDFVMKGGHLFCEDWTVKEVVEKAFPKYVSAGQKLLESTVDVMPARGMGTHPYLKGIFEPKLVEPPPGVMIAGDLPPSVEGAPDEPKKGRTAVVKAPPPPPAEPAVIGDEVGKPIQVKHNWKIDLESWALKVTDKSKVVTLLTSGKLQKDAGGDGAVAVAFRPGSSGIPPAQKSVPRGTPGVVTVVLSHFGKQQSTDDEQSIQNLLLNVLIDANAAREERAAATPAAKAAKKAEKKAEKEAEKEAEK